MPLTRPSSTKCGNTAETSDSDSSRVRRRCRRCSCATSIASLEPVGDSARTIAAVRVSVEGAGLRHPTQNAVGRNAHATIPARVTHLTTSPRQPMGLFTASVIAEAVASAFATFIVLPSALRSLCDLRLSSCAFRPFAAVLMLSRGQVSEGGNRRTRRAFGVLVRTSQPRAVTRTMSSMRTPPKPGM